VQRGKGKSPWHPKEKNSWWAFHKFDRSFHIL
jgi:hypothetical protein